MDVDRAFALISAAARRGKTPNAYLFVGRLRGDAYALAVKTLSLFFDRHVEDRAHPDIHWLFPEKKSRIISVEAVHERLVGPALETPYLDGWKAGVVMGAECFNPASANAFLKTLEEPPPKTLFLLLTAAPERLLPTIVSRCQRIDLDDLGACGLDAAVRGRIEEIVAGAGGSWSARAAAAGRMSALLEEFKALAEKEVADDVRIADSGAGEDVDKDELNARVNARYREHRLDVMHAVTDCFRRLMARAATETPPPVPLAAAFSNIARIEEAVIRLDQRNMPEAAVLGQLFDLLALPAARRNA